MSNTNQLQYVKHKDIDSENWNRCIANANNSRVYANEWHLDRTAITWDALVWDDYEFVMPLPIKSKLGIKYIYQPLFCQQLGIFPSPTPEIANTFYKFIVQNFRFSDIHINSENPIQKKEIIEFFPRKNHILELNKSYQEIASEYSKNAKRNIAKAGKNNLSYTAGISLEDYLNFKIKNLAVNIGAKEFANLKSLIAYGQYKGIGEISGVYSAENKLCAAVYFCRWNDRVVYLNAASNQSGKELRAMYFLIDSFIQTAVLKGLTLDFEGSMVPGVARFYEGFGARPETYFQLKFNRLPLPLKWFKR